MQVNDESQICRDLLRTFPDIHYFTKEGGGCETLNRILLNICKKDQRRGYI